MFFFKKKPKISKNKLPEKLVALKYAPQPAWVWDGEYRTIVWANVAGLEFWKVSSQDEIKELLFPENHSMVLTCNAVVKKLTHGKIIQETMTLLTRPKVSDFTCKLEEQALPDGRKGILISINTLQSHQSHHSHSASLELPHINSRDSDDNCDDSVMLENPATFSCDADGIIVGVNDIAYECLNLRQGNSCLSIFANKHKGYNITRRIMREDETYFVEKLDIGFGFYPYLVQSTQFIHDNTPHFNVGILRVSNEQYQDFLNNQPDDNTDDTMEFLSDIDTEDKNIDTNTDTNTDTDTDTDAGTDTDTDAGTDIDTKITEKNNKEFVIKNTSHHHDADEDFMASPFIDELTELAGVDVGIFDVTNDGIIKMANQIGCKLTGYDKNSLVGKNIIHLFGSEAELVLKDLIVNRNRAILDDLADGVHCQYNDVHNIQHIVKLIVRSNRTRNGFWFIVNDNTELEQIKSELLELKKHTQETMPAVLPKTEIKNLETEMKIPSLVNAVSHEIRAPLNAIAGYAEMIESDIFGILSDNRYKEFATSIRGAGEYALSIVNELLDYSKLKAGGFTAHFTEVNIDTIATDAIATVYPQARMRHIDIVKTVLTGTPLIRSDARLLKQILINLLTNAIKYSLDNEQILLTAGLTKTGRLMIEVTDFGRGMTEQEIHDALTPFKRGQYDNDMPGTGLGLSLSKELTELTHGRFMIDSTPKEKTRIRIIYEDQSIVKQPEQD